MTPTSCSAFDYGLLLAGLIGHFGIHLAAYNRVNATGFSHRTVKLTALGVLVSAVALPALALWDGLTPAAGESATVAGCWLRELAASRPWQVYGVVCLLSWPVLGIPWLLARPLLGIGHVRAKRDVEVVPIAEMLETPLTLTRKSHWWSRIPGNQLLELAVEQIELPVVGLPPELDGYRIAQLSDLHFTGHVAPAWTAEVVGRMNRWEPDLIALTGDIVDSPDCIDWLEEALGHAEAVDGRYFILGNHDVRKVRPEHVREAMEAIGWIDVGGRAIETRLTTSRNKGRRSDAAVTSLPAWILGNESPWLKPPVLDWEQDRSDHRFRLLLAHSPDQFGWARKHGIQLMLAGHTHGGQGRLPGLGPLVSPSWHGSRYASGDFYRWPTTMHVSRGLSGAHLVRIHCRPELSLLTLRRRVDEIRSNPKLP